MPIDVDVSQTNYLISVSAPTSTIDVALTGDESVEVSITSAPILVDVTDGNTVSVEVANVGVPGPQGPAGAAGQGVPTGGTAGQVLAKIDGTDYNTEWVPQSGGGRALAVSAGTSSASVTNLVFSNSNNLSFGLNGSTVTASASFAQSSLSFSNANGVTFGTAGSTLTASVAAQSSLSYANGGGVTFGTAGSTLTASVQTNYLTSQSNQAFSASGGSSAFQTLNFANSNGFTFSNSNGSVIGSYTVPTQTQFVLSNSNGISFGTNGSTVTASYTVPNVPAQTEYVFSNSNGVTFGTNGSTVTASVNAGGAAPTISWFEPYPLLNPQGVVQSSMHLQRFSANANISATMMDIIMAISNSASAGATISRSFGIYGLSGSTASLLSSASVSLGFNSTAAASSYTACSATRYHSMPVTMNITPGEYIAGMIFHISTSGTSGTYSFACNRSALTVQQRPFGGGNRTEGFGYGVYGTATTVLPASFQLTNMVQTSNVAIRPPWFALVGTF